MLIAWDETKRQANLAKHKGMDFADLTLEFFRDATIIEAHSDRLKAIGEFQSRLVIVVIFVPLGTEALSVISMRAANRRERKML